eukprot:4140145-Prymnesium_polylepis.1
MPRSRAASSSEDRNKITLIACLSKEFQQPRRKARCPFGTDRHISPGRWVSTRACAPCPCASVCEPVPTCQSLVPVARRDVEEVECGATGSAR